jgi:hypothetical protein
MSTTTQIDDRIGTFFDGGKSSLAHYKFVSASLNKEKGSTRARLFDVKAASPAVADTEKEVEFKLNRTGNIFYATTSPTLQDETKKLFASVTVLFAAMTKALGDKNKTLFDYDSWCSLIRKSGYFVEVQKFQTILHIEKNSLEVNTQIIQQLIPGLMAGPSMDVAKSVLAALNGAYSLSKTTATTKLGHIMFICEELFGAPSVTVRLFFATKESHQKLTSSPCHKSISESIDQQQEADTFLFVSPDTIAEFAKKFGDVPAEYDNLVKKLSGYIT